MYDPGTMQHKKVNVLRPPSGPKRAKKVWLIVSFFNAVLYLQKWDVLQGKIRQKLMILGLLKLNSMI